MKRTLSLILSLLMVFSLFTGMSISAAAARPSDLAETGAAIISTADISVTAPRAGDSPDFSPSAGNAVFTIATVRWTSWETGTSVVMSSSDIFRAGFNYSLAVEIVPKSGYQFATADSGPAVTAKLNGIDASVYSVSGYSSAKRIKVVKTFANVADTGIKSVQANIAAPVPGEYPSYDVSIPVSNAGYEVEDYDGVYYKDGVYWSDDTAGSYIKWNEPVKFIAGHQYTVTISLVTKSGYTFFKTTSSISGKINGKTATVVNLTDADNADLNIGLKYQFTCEKEKINSIAVSVTPPVSGQKPTFSATENASGYDVYTALNTSIYKNGVEWYDLTAGSTVATNGSVSFINGHQYRVSVMVKANQAYEFPTTTVTGTVNGKSGSVLAMYSYDKAQFRTVECEFTAINAVTSVAVIGVTEPVAGQKPSYSASVPSGAKYKIEVDFNNDPWHNGIIWRNETDDKSMSPSDTFESGKQYQVTISLIKTDDPFFTDVTGTLNGKPANIKKYGDGTANIGVTRTFTASVPATIVDSVSVTVPEPQAGERMPYTATVPAGKGYAVQDWNNPRWQHGVCWKDEDDSQVAVADEKRFESGKQYTVIVCLELTDTEKYAFAPAAQLTALVNGKEASVEDYNDGTYGILYTFIVPASSAGYIIGDADTNGKISILDATAIQRKLANLPVSAYNEKAADADQDGKVTILDATAIQRYLASLSTNKNIGQPMS